jgi:hypothetical protein
MNATKSAARRKAISVRYAAANAQWSLFHDAPTQAQREAEEMLLDLRADQADATAARLAAADMARI